MSIRAQADPRDIAKLNNLFSDVAKYTTMNVDKMIKRTMRYAVQSAANATKPRKGANKSGNRRGGKLRNKDLYKPLVKMPASMGVWYTKNGRNAPFKVDKVLSRSEVARQKVKRVTKGIKSFVKGKGWTYRPWAGKRNIKNKAFEIPYAGLAKDGWYRALKNLGDKKGNPRRKRNSKARGIHSTRIAFMNVEVINRVSYISKSSPAAGRYGLNRATKRIVGQETPKIERAIERRFNR